MKMCFCRVLLPLAIVVISLIWWPAGWARIAIVVAAGLMAVAGFFPAACCCMKQDRTVELERPSSSAA